jgi:hypothetical protein
VLKETFVLIGQKRLEIIRVNIAWVCFEPPASVFNGEGAQKLTIARTDLNRAFMQKRR